MAIELITWLKQDSYYITSFHVTCVLSLEEDSFGMQIILLQDEWQTGFPNLSSSYSLFFPGKMAEGEFKRHLRKEGVDGNHNEISVQMLNTSLGIPNVRRLEYDVTEPFWTENRAINPMSLFTLHPHSIGTPNRPPSSQR